MKTIGFFGGSFDPVHFGHLNLAMEMLEKGKLDEVLFCPAFCSPFKLDHPPVASGEHRYEMLKRVLADVPGCEVTPIEVEQKGPSYTVDTLRRLQKGGVQYRLILSEEAAVGFGRWKEPQEILRLAPPLVGRRGGEGQGTMKFIPTRCVDISSTEVRARLKKKMYCGHLIPKNALDYIARHDLYSS